MRERWHLTIEARPQAGEIPTPIQRLRRLVKHMLRFFGFKLVKIEADKSKEQA